MKKATSLAQFADKSLSHPMPVMPFDKELGANAISFVKLLAIELAAKNELLTKDPELAKRAADAQTRCLRGESFPLNKSIRAVCKKIGCSPTKQELGKYLRSA